MPLPRRRSRRAAAAAAKAAIAALSKKPVMVIQKKKKIKNKHPPPTRKPVAAAAVAKKKRSKNPPAKKKSAPIAPTKKTKLTGLAHAVLDTSKTLGVVDPEANLLPPGQSTIANLDNQPCDVMLSLINPAQNSDKFFILQLFHTTNDNENNNNTRSNNNNKWIVYTRWGRTGTTGQALQQDFTDAATAQKVFGQKFKQKTGLTWADRSEPSLNGKYRFVEQDYTQKVSGFNGATWQYWVDDGVDGKSPGWYDYTRDASQNVERLHSEHTRNTDFLSDRWVSSGCFTYNVNLTTMMQTNVTHANRKSRHIRRCPAGVAMSREPPTPATV